MRDFINRHEALLSAKKSARLIPGEPISFASIEDAIEFSNGAISREEVARRFLERPPDQGPKGTFTVTAKTGSSVTIETK